MAAPACKASWTVRSAANLGEDLARAMRTAKGGRPGPVHLSLPSDLLEGNVDAVLPEKAAFHPADVPRTLSDETLALLRKAKMPLLIGSPAFGTSRGRAALQRFEDATGVPAIVMESPRGVNDPSQGLLAEILAAADVVVLAGKRRDFTLKFGATF